MKIRFIVFLLMLPLISSAQVMTPEMLWSLGRVSPVGISEDESSLVYKVTTPDIAENTFNSETFVLDLKTGIATRNDSGASILKDNQLSPDGNWKLSDKSVKIQKISGEDLYPEMTKSNALIFNELNIRHWDTWETGTNNHVILEMVDGSEAIDIMEDEPYDTPTKPFGGSEDYTWGPEGKTVVYVSKKLKGNDYVNSTNTDLYEYTLSTKTTKNLTESNPGYDTNPLFSNLGTLAWLSMARDGYESDKNDIKIMINGKPVNLTADWDGTVNSFIWGSEGKDNLF